MKKSVIIVAGGKGLRMGNEVPKQFLPVEGRPVLMRTIDAFLAWDSDMQIVLALPQSQIPYWEQLCVQYGFQVEKLKVVCGGVTRFHSVKNALDVLSGEGIVAVHDGVRPFVSSQMISRCFDLKNGEKAAIPVVPVVDSLRKVEGTENFTVNRSDYVAVQTPQVFDLQTLKQAYEQNVDKAESFTDDANVIETLDVKIKLVEGERSNIKITTPVDMALAKVILDSK